MAIDPDWKLRAAAIATVQGWVRAFGPVLPWSTIEQGFVWEGRPYLLASQAVGIFRPKAFTHAALSIKTTMPRQGRAPRYADLASDGGFDYRFQGDDPTRFDNVWLGRAYEGGLPLIYWYGVEPTYYAPLLPAYIDRWDVASLTCRVVLADQAVRVGRRRPLVSPTQLRVERRYATVEAKRRLHQATFRRLVLGAYEERCAVCGLPRRELLEAAHIVPDRDRRGEPEVPNGLALCQLHHGAFDADLLGIRPDGRIEIAPSLLDAQDGPLLEHGLKGFHEKPLRRPRYAAAAPREELLAERYARFCQVA